jgi:hypothetical protein
MVQRCCRNQAHSDAHRAGFREVLATYPVQLEPAVVGFLGRTLGLRGAARPAWQHHRAAGQRMGGLPLTLP